VESSSARVRFIRFGASSLDLEVFAYVLLADFGAFLEVQEELLLRIMDIIEGAGTGIAFPSQTTYFAKDSGLDAEKSQAAIAEVRRRSVSDGFFTADREGLLTPQTDR
jgi:MscS family membrane protein